MIKPIASPQNESMKIWRQLSVSKGIRKNRAFFLMGEKLIAEFLREPRLKVLAEVMGPDHRSLLEGRAYDAIHKYQLTRELFDELDVIGTHFNLLLLEAPEIPVGPLPEPRGLELILPLGDPTNLGAAVRSALAFGVSRVHLTEEASHPFHPKALKASAGAVLGVAFSRLGKLGEVVAGANKNMFVLDQGGVSLHGFRWPKNLFLVVGEEGPGVGKHDCPVLSIPTQNVESLNAAVCVSLACYSYRWGEV